MNQDTHTNERAIIVIILAIVVVCAFVIAYFSSQSVRTIFHVEPHSSFLSDNQIQVLANSLQTSSSTPALSVKQKTQLFKAVEARASTTPLSLVEQQKLFEAIKSQ